VNIKEYISSGIVESYVLGLASEQERSEFEQLCVQYPELVAARNEFELNLEKQAFALSIPASGTTKDKVMNAIRNQDSSETETKIITMDTRTHNNGWLRFVAAASIILLLISAWFVYDQRSETKALRQQVEGFQARIDSINAINEGLTQQNKKALDPNSAVVVSMVGTQPSSSSANVYWDTASTNVFLVVKNLPKLPTEKQYQLWAFIEGKPVDLGLFDPDNKNVILQMKNTQKAEAFAITIENRGNGSTPQGKVETLGKVEGSDKVTL
jgi:anti-sigma-K factor RskA